MHPYEHACIGDYTIVAPLARAPSIDGHVLLAVNQFGANRALKIGALGTDHKINTEAQTLSSLTHPNILTLCHTGEWDGQPYLVTAPYCASNLEERIKTQKLDALDAKHIGRQTLDALAHAHAQGIYHLDLAPRHILFSPDGRAMLCDFGNAKTAPLDQSLSSAHALGSMPYMNVEQLSGKKPNAKMDLYALGTILAHASLGHLWDNAALPSTDPFLRTFIRALTSPTGYHTAKDALAALDEDLRRDPTRETLTQENKYLREHARNNHRELTYHSLKETGAVSLAASVGFLIGSIAIQPLFAWLLR